jgi:hypothetical protein
LKIGGLCSIISCLILHLDCKCQTIEITLKNAALAKQGSRQGSYQRGQIVNGKPSWTSTSNAIWYNVLSKDWGIGRIEKIGTSTVGIASDGDQGFSSCPFTVPNGKWKYSDGTRKFVVAPSGDISVKCVSGNDRLLVLLQPHLSTHPNPTSTIISWTISWPAITVFL